MTVYLGLDLSKSATGYAFCEVRSGVLGSGTEYAVSYPWTAGVLKCPVRKPEGLEAGKITAAYSGAVSDWFQTALFALVKEHRPDKAAIEMPKPGNLHFKRPVINKNTMFAGEAITYEDAGGTRFDTLHFAHGLAFVAAGLLARLSIPTVFVTDGTWRPAVGIGKPPKGTKNSRDWYKAEAIKLCGFLKIPVKGDDMAEAVLIAHWLKAQDNPMALRRPGELAFAV